MLVARQLHQHLAMACGQLGEIIAVLADARLSSGASAACKRGDQRLRAIEFLVAEPGPRLGAMQRRGLAAPELCQFVAETGEVAREPAAARLRPRAAQQRQLERLDGVLECAWRAAEPAQRMLQQRQQGRRLQSALPPPRPRAARKCRPTCPSARRRRNRRRRDSSGRAPPSPAAPARDPASPAPPICPDAAPRASRPRSPAPPSRDWRASITARFVHAAAKSSPTMSGCGQPPMPLRGRVRRPHRLGDQHLAATRRRLARGFRHRRA